MEAVAAMTTLNEAAARAALAHGVRAATDVTGFGLLGHLDGMLRASGVGAELTAGAVPVFAGVRALAEAGVAPGGTMRNLEAVAVSWDPALSRAAQVVLADAQTSGGLLLAVPPDRATALVATLRAGDTPQAAVIGKVVAEGGLWVGP